MNPTGVGKKVVMGDPGNVICMIGHISRWIAGSIEALCGVALGIEGIEDAACLGMPREKTGDGGGVDGGDGAVAVEFAEKMDDCT